MTARFTEAEVLAATGAPATRSGSRVFEGVSTDTRTLASGMLYVALKGERFDGHTFLGEAGLVLRSVSAFPDVEHEPSVDSWNVLVAAAG